MICKVIPSNLMALITGFYFLTFNNLLGAIPANAPREQPGKRLLAATDQDSDCLKYVDQNSKNTAQFMGFGQGLTNDLAVDNASLDLSKQIRSRVSSAAQVSETNTHAEFDVQSSSSVSELLLGMEVIKRCKLKDGNYQAVALLSKTKFVQNLEKTLQLSLDQAAGYSKDIGAGQGAAASIKAVIGGEKYLKERRDEIVSSYELCKVFNGCGAVTLDTLTKLSELIKANSSTIKFIYQPADKESAVLAEKLVSLLNVEGFTTIVQSAGSKDDSNFAKATCAVTHFPSMAGTPDQISEVVCHVDLWAGNHKIDTLNYEGKGIGPSKVEAWQGARRDIKKAD